MFGLRWRWLLLVLFIAAIGFLGNYYTIGGLENLRLVSRGDSGKQDNKPPVEREENHAYTFDEARYQWQDDLSIGEKLAVWQDKLPLSTAGDSPKRQPAAPVPTSAVGTIPRLEPNARSVRSDQRLPSTTVMPVTSAKEPASSEDSDVPIAAPIPLPPGFLIPRHPPTTTQRIEREPANSNNSQALVSQEPSPFPATQKPEANRTQIAADQRSATPPITANAPSAPNESTDVRRALPNSVPIRPRKRTSQRFTADVTSNPAANGMYWDSPEALARSAKAIRVASFNVQSLTCSKISKPQVLESLVSILRRYDVVALQEVQSERDDLLPMLVDKLNKSGRKFDYLIGPRVGRVAPFQQFAIVFDTERVETDRYALYTVDDPNDLIAFEPLVAWFRCKGVPASEAFTFSLVDLRIDPTMAAEERRILPSLINAIIQDGRGEDDWILAGDIGGSSAQLADLASHSVRFAIQDMPTNIEGTRMLDSIFFSSAATTEYTGKSGALDFLRSFNLSIERAMQISDHMPVWAEFSIVEGAEPGRVAPPARKPVF